MEDNNQMGLDSLDFNKLLEEIRLVYGYDFTGYAESSLKRRVVHYMKQSRSASLNDIRKKVFSDEEELEKFIHEISVTVTEMFRDPSFFKTLRSKVISRLCTYPHLKIWLAGCATGEEIYSLAILLKEEGLLHRSIIYATDINQWSLEKAKSGIYNADKMRLFTESYQKSGGKNSFSDYYKVKFNSVMFDKSLREKIVFAAHNLAVDKSFNEFQLIICRNVLIYFKQELQNRVISLFYESLCNFGYLGLGNKESLLFSDKIKNFDVIDRKNKIFMKIK